MLWYDDAKLGRGRGSGSRSRLSADTGRLLRAGRGAIGSCVSRNSGDQDRIASAMGWQAEPEPGAPPERQIEVYRAYLGEQFEVTPVGPCFETLMTEISCGRRPVVSEIQGHVRIVYGWRREAFGDYAYIGDPSRGERRLDNWEYPSHTRLIVIRRRLASAPGF